MSRKSEVDMILVTGAGGKTGRAIIRALVGYGKRVKAFVFKSAYAKEMVKLGAEEVVWGDFLNPADLRNALKQVQAVYHICPNMHPEEFAIGKALVEAMCSTDCRRIVYHSVLHPQTEAMPHHWQKLRVEEMLFESGLDYSILQPCAYLQNIIKDIDRILADRVYTIPYHPSAKFSFVDLTDVAEAAAKVCLSDEYIGGIYELCGPEALSVSAVLEKLGKLKGKKIEVIYQSPDEWCTQPEVTVLPEYKRTGLHQMFSYYSKNGLWGSSKVLELLLNRSPASVDEVLKNIGL